MTGSPQDAAYAALPSVLVVVSGWPRVSETFAVNELLALRRAGMLAGIVATKPGDSTALQPGHAELAPMVTVLADANADAQADELVAIVRSMADQGRPVTALHGYFAHRPAELAALAGRRLGIRYGFSVHALDLRKVEPDVLRERAAAADVVITCNTDAATSLTAAGIDARLIPHGVDLDRFAPPTAVRRDLDRAGGRIELLAVGRLVEKKGFATLIQAMALLADSRVHLTIVGDGPERADLGALAFRLGVADQVDLAGRTDHHRLPDLYRRADIVVAPSIVDRHGDRDGLPNVVLEALACGRPLIASDVAAIASAVQTDPGAPANGVLVPPGDAAALADAIRDLADHPARRAALGHAARRTAEQRFELHRCSHLFCTELATIHAGEPVDRGARP